MEFASYKQRKYLMWMFSLEDDCIDCQPWLKSTPEEKIRNKEFSEYLTLKYDFEHNQLIGYKLNRLKELEKKFAKTLNSRGELK